MKNLIMVFIGLLLGTTFYANAKPSKLYTVGSNTLNAGEQLVAGQFLVSPNGNYHLRYQHDGNFVLYRDGNIALWSSKTHGTSPGKVIMQSNGGLVVRNAANKVVWLTGTGSSQNQGSRLVVQNDGNVVLYRPNNQAIWSTQTGTPVPPAADNVLGPNEFLLRDQTIFSPNGKYNFFFNSAGNIGLHEGGGIFRWYETLSGPTEKLIMQKSDGNLVMYKSDGTVAWASHTASPANHDSRLVVQDDGNLIIYNTQNVAIWNLNIYLESQNQ